jgi:hypothetical protein
VVGRARFGESVVVDRLDKRGHGARVGHEDREQQPEEQ